MRDEEIIAFRSSTKKLCEEVNIKKHSNRVSFTLISITIASDALRGFNI